MRRGVAIGLGIGLVVLGLLTAAFFGLLLAIADCSDQCRAQGQQFIPMGLIALGIGAAVGGVMLVVRGGKHLEPGTRA